MVHLLEDCNLCAIHAKRVTISALLSCPRPVVGAYRLICAPSDHTIGPLALIVLKPVLHFIAASVSSGWWVG